MSQKLIKTSGIVIAVVLALLFTMSAFMKIAKNEDAVAQAAGIGIDANTYFMIGIVEILSVVLFLIPRTALLGSMLLVAYMGGAIATHVQHQQPIFMAVLIQVLVWVSIFLRFPELRQQLIPIKKS